MNKNSWKMRCMDGGNSNWKVGDIIVVKDNKGTQGEYCVDGDFSSFNAWCEERKTFGSKWELIEENFTKSDLQECDVVVLRNEERAVYFDQYIRNKNRDLSIEYYDWDMTKIKKQLNQYDVMQVYRNGELIFDREEKSPIQIEIESIEEEQRKLADRLSELRKGL